MLIQVDQHFGVVFQVFHPAYSPSPSLQYMILLVQKCLYHNWHELSSLRWIVNLWESYRWDISVLWCGRLCFQRSIRISIIWLSLKMISRGGHLSVNVGYVRPILLQWVLLKLQSDMFDLFYFWYYVYYEQFLHHGCRTWTGNFIHLSRLYSS